MTSPIEARDVHRLRRSTDGSTCNDPDLYDLCNSTIGHRSDEVRRPNSGGSMHTVDRMSNGLSDDDVSDTHSELVHFTNAVNGSLVVETTVSDMTSQLAYDGQSSALRRHNIRRCPDVSVAPSAGHAITPSKDFRRHQRHLNNAHCRTNDVIKSCVKAFDVHCRYCPPGSRLATLDAPLMAMKQNAMTSAPSTPMWQSFPRRPPLLPSAHDDVMAAIVRSRDATDAVRHFTSETIDLQSRPTNLTTTTSQASYFDYFQLDRWIGGEGVLRRPVLNPADNSTPVKSLTNSRRMSDNFQLFDCRTSSQSSRHSNEHSVIQTTRVDKEYLMESPLNRPISRFNTRDTVPSTRSDVEGQVSPDFVARGRDRSRSLELSSSADDDSLFVSSLSALAFYEYLLRRYDGRDRSPDCGTISSKEVIHSPYTGNHQGDADDQAPTAPPSVVGVNCSDNESRQIPPAAGPGRTLFRPYLDLMPQSSAVGAVTRTDTVVMTPSPGNSVDDRLTEVSLSSPWRRHQRRRIGTASCSLMTSQTTALLRSKRYTCDLCGRTFSRSNTLVTHRRIHTGEKPFSCELCGRFFRQPGNLTRHRLTHTASRPFPCLVCARTFNRAANLHAHMRVHAVIASTPSDAGDHLALPSL